jgi:signal transduction histidine kinase
MNRTEDEPNKTIDEGEWPFLFKDVEANAKDALNLLSINLECARICLARTSDSSEARQAELSTLIQGASIAYNRLERIQDQAFRLMECIDGTAKPNWERVDLLDLLRELCAVAQEIEQDLGVKLVYGAASSLKNQCKVEADSIYLQQIVLQLLSNALRACEPGGQVRMRLEEEKGELCLRITDDGCGLPDRAALGENRTRFVGGTGLGLRLCRAYCALLGWTLELKSRRKGGTEAVLHILRNGPQNMDSAVLRCTDSWEEEARRLQMQHAVRRELHSVPGLEEAELALYADKEKI